LSGRALAQADSPEVALNRFEPSFAGDRLLGVQSPYSAGHPGLHIALMGDYARNPLVLRRDGSGDEVGAIVSSQLFLHVNSTLSLVDLLSINLDVPVAVYQAGDDPSAGGISFTSPDSVRLGDMRLGLRCALLGKQTDPVQLAVGALAWAPTGAADSFVSDKSIRALAQVIVGGMAVDRFLWTSSVGFQARPANDVAGTSTGSELQWRVGAAALVDARKHLQVGLEYAGALVARDIGSRSVHGEVLASAKYRFLPNFDVGIGVGPGLGEGIGTPDFRALAMLTYSPAAVEQPGGGDGDGDGDGVTDPMDACPDVPGPASDDPANNGCPPPSDRDADGVVDSIDACPDTPGVEGRDPARSGCPADRDRDGVPEPADACPDDAGVVRPDPAMNGCPTDADGDGITDAKDACLDLKGVPHPNPAKNGCPPNADGDKFPDDVDACPREKGPDDPDPTKKGCPRFVRVTSTEITILQPVQFHTDIATIKWVSYPLLDEVAGALRDHPEILKLEVQGHTDNWGLRALNTKLSQKHAEAVRAALVARGINAGRLHARGYGPDVPIGDNKTAEGSAANRRVQFVIIEKAENKP
jgi:outer membrane protein OmpA-like peptidoglycan-associated protein